MKATEAYANTESGKVKWVIFNSKTYATILYFLLALPLGIIYFTVSIIGLALSIGLTPIFIGIPLFFGVAKLLNGIVSFEQNMIRQILGLPPTPVIHNATGGQPSEVEQNWFMRMVRGFDGVLFMRNLLLILLRFITGIIFLVITLTVVSLALGLITVPVVHIILMNELELDILEHSLFTYFHIDWSYNQQYLLYVGIGLVLYWIALRIVNGLMQVQRRIMYVDEPYEHKEQSDLLHHHTQSPPASPYLYYEQTEEQPTPDFTQPAYREL